MPAGQYFGEVLNAARVNDSGEDDFVGGSLRQLNARPGVFYLEFGP